jgi:hypothetical protein
MDLAWDWLQLLVGSEVFRLVPVGFCRTSEKGPFWVHSQGWISQTGSLM